MNKVLRIGTVKMDGRNPSIYIAIKEQGGRVSFTGVIGPKANGDAVVGCGQIDMEFAHRNPAHDDKRYSHPIKPEEIAFVEPWDAEKWLDLLDMWKRWHLNDMHAECEHQRARGENWTTHPSAVCPDCGYKLGSRWLREDVPADVLATIQSLPDADVTPAWV